MLGDTELFRERVEAATALQNRLAAARLARDLDGVRAVQADLGDLDRRQAGLLIDLLQSYRAVEAHADMVDLVAAMPAVLRRAPQVREHHAFALNRLARRPEAEDILLQLIDERGPDSETNGLLGRVYKDQWEEARNGGTPAARGLLDRAIAAYLAGFEADWRDHYPGINAVQLMYQRDPCDQRIAELLPVVRYSARLKARRNRRTSGTTPPCSRWRCSRTMPTRPGRHVAYAIYATTHCPGRPTARSRPWCDFGMPANARARCPTGCVRSRPSSRALRTP